MQFLCVLVKGMFSMAEKSILVQKCFYIAPLSLLFKTSMASN